MTSESDGNLPTSSKIFEDNNLKRKRELNEPLSFHNKKDNNEFSNNLPYASKNFNDQDNSTEQTENIIRLKVYYLEKDSGILSVWVKKIKSEGPELSAFKVGSILYKSYKNISDIRRRGKYNVEVICKNYIEANKIIDDDNLKPHGPGTFVPGYRKIRKGIVRRIPLDLSEQEILNACESPVKHLEVKRLNRRNIHSTSDENKWFPCQSLAIIDENSLHLA